MKKLEIIIKPEKLEDLKALLDSEEVNGLNIVNSMGYGNQKGIIKNYRGAEYAVNLLPKIKVETVVTDEVAPKLIDKIVEQINTGHIGDGKIFMYEVEDAIRIRTGEHGVMMPAGSSQELTFSIIRPPIFFTLTAVPVKIINNVAIPTYFICLWL